jgi:alkanesulfonate monooxygenase SsuD/methylene tetrahydromethanopterin reductase-like flavin-dependent oxidoreductase (luciferase family)
VSFGHFFYPMNLDASRDYQAIADCLAEAELVEQLGFDAIWISEHHCAGEAVYGDALVFAAAVDDQALEECLPTFQWASRYIADIRERWNPKDQQLPQPPPPLPRSAYAPTPNSQANEALVGSPQRVTEQIALLQESGARNLMLTNRGLLSREQTLSSLRLLSDQVMPQFR